MNTRYSVFCTGVFIFFCFSLLVCAGETRLSGIVVDATNRKPLRGAEVYLVQARQGAVTDADGYFLIVVSAPLSELEQDTLVVSFVGYREFRSTVAAFRNRSEIRLVPQNVELADSVLVRGERIDLVKQEIPHSRTTIDFRQIELRGSSEIGDLFKNVSSVRIEGNDLQGRRIEIRGSDADEVNVYIDGFLINNLGLDNSADFSMVAVDNIEKVEVLKGANLTLLGNGAFGGVVNITTKKGLKKSAGVKTRQGSFDSQYYISQFNYPLSRKLALNYFGQFNTIKPGIEFFPGEALLAQKTENDLIEVRKQNHNVALNFYLAEGEISTRFYGYFLDYQKPAWQDKRNNYLLAGSFKGRLLGISNLDLNLHYLIGDDAIEQEKVADQTRFTYEFNSRILNFRASKKFVFNRNELQLLGEYFHDEVAVDRNWVRSDGTVPLYDALLYENRWSGAAVLAFQNLINGDENLRWRTHLGFRDDLLATGDNYFAPSVGFQLEIKRAEWLITPYANYGKNVRFHSLRDNAFAQLTGEIAQAGDSLRRFRPEQSNAFEVGASAHYRPGAALYRSLDADAALFRNTIFNKLLRHPRDPAKIFLESGRNVTAGAEVSLRFNKLLTYFDLSFSGMALHFSDSLIYSFKPANKISMQLDFHSPWGFYLSGAYFREGESFGWDDLRVITQDSEEFIVPVGKQTIPAFFDLDLSLGYRFRIGSMKFNLQAAGLNILDNSGYQNYLINKQFFQFTLSAKY